VEALDDARSRLLRGVHRELEDLRIFRRRGRRERAPRVQGRDQVAEDDDPLVAASVELRLSVNEPSDLRSLELPLKHRQIAAALAHEGEAHLFFF
jgi:hypothetical protein